MAPQPGHAGLMSDLRGSVIESNVQGEASAEIPFGVRGGDGGAIERATSFTSATHVVVERVFTRRR